MGQNVSTGREEKRMGQKLLQGGAHIFFNYWYKHGKERKNIKKLQHSKRNWKMNGHLSRTIKLQSASIAICR